MDRETAETGNAGELWSGSWPAARHAARLRQRARHGWRQLGFRRQFVAILVVAAVVSAVGTVILAALWMPPVRPEVGLLLLIGLALTALCLYAGYRLSGPVSHRAYTALTGGLDQIAESAVHMEALSAGQATRSRQQALIARQLSEEVRVLGETAERLEHGVALLRESAGQMWAELSYPATAVDTPLSGRSARQAVITASQIGAAIEQTTALCYRLRARTNLVIAEADMLGAQGREAEYHLGALREGVRRVEEALGGTVPAPRYTASDRIDAVLRPTRNVVLVLAGAVARWGAPRWPLRRDAAGAAHSARLAPASGVSTRTAANTLNARNAAAHGASLSRASSGRHPAVGGRTRSGNATSRGRALSQPRLPDTAAQYSRGRDGAHYDTPDQASRNPRPTPRTDDEWLNGTSRPH